MVISPKYQQDVEGDGIDEHGLNTKYIHNQVGAVGFLNGKTCEISPACGSSSVFLLPRSRRANSSSRYKTS